MRERTKRSTAAALVRDYLLPPTCPSCTELSAPCEDGASPFCEVCRPIWEKEMLAACPRCKLLLTDCVCIPERLRDVGVRDTVTLALYRPDSGTVADRTVFYLKENRDPRVFRYLASELSARALRLLREIGVEAETAVVTYLPRRRAGVRENGFDQAKELARALAIESGLPFLPCLRRSGRGAEQKSLTREEREENTRKAFRLSRDTDLSGRTVILVDDVVTTGSGLMECARLLFDGGADAVIPVTVLRTEERA